MVNVYCLKLHLTRIIISARHDPLILLNAGDLKGTDGLLCCGNDMYTLRDFQYNVLKRKIHTIPG